jgi:hypothetical protein
MGRLDHIPRPLVWPFRFGCHRAPLQQPRLGPCPARRPGSDPAGPDPSGADPADPSRPSASRCRPRRAASPGFVWHPDGTRSRLLPRDRTSGGPVIPLLAEPSLGYNQSSSAAENECRLSDRSREGGGEREAAKSEKPRNRQEVAVVPEHQDGDGENPVAAIAEEIATYRSRPPELLAHEGQFVLIKGDQIIGFFDDDSEAIREGYCRFAIAPFLVKRVAASERVVYIPNVVL